MTDEWSEFLEKLDYEGGVASMLAYGGSGLFPEEIRALAEYAEAALGELTEAIFSKERAG